ncbi:MAG: hypothetical protein M3R03_07475 [Pseudomonadota bacterium]|nr:hypothetical protein [Pseudomonadota bacterium]
MPGPTRTPSHLRFHCNRPSAPPLPQADPALRPELGDTGRDPGQETEAFGEWLGHLAAGRIEIR